MRKQCMHRRRRWHPLQSSCLENPRDGGAWWAAVHGITKSDKTEQLHFHFSLSCIGEGNGNPLPCSCLENPRDKEACQGTVHGVAKYQTQLSDWEHTHIYTGRVAGFSHEKLWIHIKETELCVKGNWETRRSLNRWVLSLHFRWESPCIGSDLERSEG